MKNLYFVQASVLYGNSVYLPYAAGALISYAFQDEEIAEYYDCKRIVYLRENTDEAIASFEEPYIVAFSNYIWNYEYNKLFAEKLRRKYPDCIIVFGGHNVPSNSPELLEELPFVDFLIHDEGEVPFRELLCSIKRGEGFSDVPNLSYRDKDGSLKKNENKIFDVYDFPSPYQTGVFDDIVSSTDLVLNGMLETNRGCPFGCAFCDWGIYKSKVRQFPMERVRKDLEWFVEHKIEFCTCADANFGILERDKEITDIIIESKKKYGYPSKIQFCFTKGREDLVFELNKKLNEVGLSKGATLSLQTFNDATLKNIGRKNPSFEEFCDIIKRYNKLDIPTYTEIILGLPGETYESFCEGLNRLLKAGQHNSIVVFNCEVLLNSRMGQKEVREQYKIECSDSVYKQHHCVPINDEVSERSHIVISTYSMTKEEWIRANLFVSSLGCFHNFGLLQCFAVYLYYEYKVDYTKFYEDLLSYIFENADTYLYGVFSDIEARLRKVAYENGSWKYTVDGCGDITWPFEEGAFLHLVMNKDRVYEELRGFLKRFNIPDGIFEDLFLFQKMAIKYPAMTDFSFSLSYDFREYFEKALMNEPVKLQKRNVRLSLRNAEIPEKWDDYARELVWYGKRGNKTNSTRDFVTEVSDDE